MAEQGVVSCQAYYYWHKRTHATGLSGSLSWNNRDQIQIRGTCEVDVKFVIINNHFYELRYYGIMAAYFGEMYTYVYIGH